MSSGRRCGQVVECRRRGRPDDWPSLREGRPEFCHIRTLSSLPRIIVALGVPETGGMRTLRTFGVTFHASGCSSYVLAGLDERVSMRLPSIDLRDYPHGSSLHSQSLNWIYANGLDPFAIPCGEVLITGNHLTAQVSDDIWRTIPMQTPPEDYGLTRRA